MRRKERFKLKYFYIVIFILILLIPQSVIAQSGETVLGEGINTEYNISKIDLLDNDLELSVVGAVNLNSNSQIAHSKEEIRAKYKESIPSLNESIIFDIEPITVGPNYREGTLSSIAKNDVRDWLNFYRYVAGVSNVELNENTMSYNAAGAVLLKNSDFSHTPARPADMSVDFYNKAIQGTTFPNNFGDYGNFASGNIAAGATLVQSIDDWVVDLQGINDATEHRFSLLSSKATSTSFGYAPGAGNKYSNFSTLTMFEANSIVENDFHVWPSAGYSPVEISDYRQKWSVVLDDNFNIKPSYTLVENGVETKYLSPLTTIIKIEHNGIVYNVTSDIIYNSVYNGFCFEIPTALKEAIKDDSTVKYKVGEKLKVSITSSDIVINSENVNITYDIEFFEAAVEEYIPVQTVNLNKISLNIPIGAKEKLVATVEPANATNKQITWVSNDENVATVDENGMVTGIAPGQAIIRATAEERYIECIVDVYRDVENVYAEQVLYELGENEKAQINYVIEPYNATYKDVTFVSNDENVATVSKDGLITAVGVGECVITLNTYNKNVSATVTVKVLAEKILVEEISFEKDVYEYYTGIYKKLDLVFGPEYANAGMVMTYSSTDNLVANVDQYGYLKTYNKGEATITATNQYGLQASCKVKVEDQVTSLKYRTHVENVGWQKFVDDGQMSGTEGKGYRLEGIILDLDSTISGNIEYTTHVQNIGWQPYVGSEQMSGTEGKGYRLEGIKIKLTGDIADYYDVYYRVHIQNTGWLSWAKNDQTAGSSGYGFRLEGIQISLVPKGKKAPDMNPVAASSSYFQEKVNVIYTTHTENIGWQKNVRNGGIQGAPGQHLRIEGIKVKLESTTSGGIKYSTHAQNIGWQPYVYNNSFAGTEGMGLRLEAIKIELTGDLALKYDIYYRIYVEGKGWLGWAKNGEEAGSVGYSRKLEGIQIVVQRKGSNPPGSTDNPCWNK